MAANRSIRVLSEIGNSEDQKPRNYYLWGCQPYFAIDLNSVANSLFNGLDENLTPETVVVAISSKENESRPTAVVEPEDHSFQPEMFSNVVRLAREEEKASPGADYCYPEGSASGAAWAKREQQRDFIARIRSVVAQLINDACSHDSPRVYVSAGREFSGYYVFSVLVIKNSEFELHPFLHRSSRDQCRVVRSLIDAAASEFVDAAFDAILSSFAGEWTSTFPSPDSLLRAAGKSFMYTPAGACDNFNGLHGRFEVCNEIAALTYEKNVGRGRLIFAKAGHENVQQTISFANPPHLDNYRAVRKLLQLTNEGESLICDSHRVLGVGTTCGNYDATREDLFCVEFVGHSKWELLHNGNTLMRVEYGLPHLPNKRFQIRSFMETFQRIFPDVVERSRAQLRQVIAAATEMSHGAILIVSANAASEADRFKDQAMRIEAMPLTPQLLESASRIDGAILASPDGKCHAIGVILDGIASPHGNAERGARYNSTVRYVLGSKAPCVGIVVSDDGMVDVVPTYHPTISKREIEEQIECLREVVGRTTVESRLLNKPMEWLHAHAFYLSQSQCDEIHQLYEAAKPKSDPSSIWRVFSRLEPHPDMNRTFLRD